VAEIEFTSFRQIGASGMAFFSQDNDDTASAEHMKIMTV
jgi:hypothetical protein